MKIGSRRLYNRCLCTVCSSLTSESFCLVAQASLPVDYIRTIPFYVVGRNVANFLGPLSQLAFDAFKQAYNVLPVGVNYHRPAAESIKQVINRPMINNGQRYQYCIGADDPASEPSETNRVESSAQE